MQSVFKYPLGPLPWSLAEPIGTLKKTSKASLLHKLKGKVNPLESICRRFALIVDGMAFVQQIKVTNITFSEFAMKLSERILCVGKMASRIDVVFDEYRDVSIKNIERQRRSRGHLSFQQIVGSAQVKQFGSFLYSNANKNALIKFVLEEWKQHKYRIKIKESIEFFVTDKQKAYMVSQSAVVEDLGLRCSHEEVDTRMILHANHAASSSYNKVMIASPDTDAFVILLTLHISIDANIYFLTGVRNLRIIIDVNKVADELVLPSNPNDVSKELLMISLVGLHSFTGCDIVSAFNDCGKVKPLKLMVKYVEYMEAFAEFGTNYQVLESLLEVLEKFVCHVYGSKINDIDQLRYKLYCQSAGKIGCKYLPPCQDVLRLNAR